jgi:hypothetical protein
MESLWNEPTKKLDVFIILTGKPPGFVLIAELIFVPPAEWYTRTRLSAGAAYPRPPVRCSGNRAE